MRIALRQQSELQEKLLLKNWDLYLELVAKAYEEAPLREDGVEKYWEALNQHSKTFFKRALSRLTLSFYTVFESDYNERKGSITVLGKEYPLELISPEEEYKTATLMRDIYKKTNRLRISIDYSEHPYLSVEENIIFRTVHDFIVHIQGDTEFGDRGEMASYNLHAKLCPPSARPALFTEIVGQVAVSVVTGNFPEQKLAILRGFDYVELGKIDDDKYKIVNKELVRK